jgi:hypothetical protein
VSSIGFRFRSKEKKAVGHSDILLREAKLKRITAEEHAKLTAAEKRKWACAINDARKRL